MRHQEANWLGTLQARGDGVRDTRVLVACSGGGDSVALLVFLWAVQESLGLELMAAHADHGLRPESAGDAAFVRDLCRRLDVDLAEAWLDVEGHRQVTGEGLETAARDLRWSWLRAEAEAFGATVVATGHTLDDHTETILIRLARGGGSGTLTPLPARQGLRWSPLIEARRHELRAYLEQLGVPWREDPTNQVGFTLRNRLRPLLEQARAEMPALDRHLWETHRQVADLLALRDARLAQLEGAAWRLDAEGLHLAPDTPEADLRFILDRALEVRSEARSADLLRDLAAWTAFVLGTRGRKPRAWGDWVLLAESESGTKPWRRLIRRGT